MKYLLLGGVITLVVVVVDLVVVIIGWCDVGECDDECEVGVVVVSPDSVGCVWGVVVGEGATIDWNKKCSYWIIYYNDRIIFLINNSMYKNHFCAYHRTCS